MFQKSTPIVLPMWNPDARELTMGGVLVKRFRTSATTQIPILEAFQRHGWKGSIANPFTRQRGERDPDERLHDGVFKLNRHQTNSILHFERNGAGRVMWTRIEPPEPPAVDNYSPD